MDKVFERCNQIIINSYYANISYARAFIAQSGERQTEDLVVAGSIPAEGMLLSFFLNCDHRYLCDLLLVDIFAQVLLKKVKIMNTSRRESA